MGASVQRPNMALARRAGSSVEPAQMSAIVPFLFLVHAEMQAFTIFALYVALSQSIQFSSAVTPANYSATSTTAHGQQTTRDKQDSSSSSNTTNSELSSSASKSVANSNTNRITKTHTQQPSLTWSANTELKLAALQSEIELQCIDTNPETYQHRQQRREPPSEFTKTTSSPANTILLEAAIPFPTTINESLVLPQEVYNYQIPTIIMQQYHPYRIAPVYNYRPAAPVPKAHQHSSGYSFCLKCPPVVVGVPVPGELRTTTVVRRGHHELSRDLQNKEAAKKNRGRAKAYSDYLERVAHRLSWENRCREQRLYTAKVRSKQLEAETQELMNALRSAIQAKEAIELEALLAFEVSPASTVMASAESTPAQPVTTASRGVLPMQTFAWAQSMAVDSDPNIAALELLPDFSTLPMSYR
ncbi:hypothetical protein SARC_04526 [Sphaeroforma arctica JP610]|uniref:BZIP domain-containing protein n=1 Tax=Sphaeroforma arctica JP610 TaxID=667725 RepID=A0A0L0G249_9EUKA|nr:hypothetical protein SARC_04526 [Sphaeroforma arctica JP610]KNC83207.1 hypothetical protein SARC_04526 [Sphaeroforma arctica JP610]|eukprot:XP_014157109.1 hypothetical protein SARC_04526 [Sphaeroforma arctica JP610]